MEQMIHNCRPLAAMATPLHKAGGHIEHKRRDQRFAATLAALSRLLLWARLERRLLMHKLLGWVPGTKVIFQEADGLPRVNCDLDVAAQFCNAPGLQQGHDEELAFGSESTAIPSAETEVQEIEDEVRCSCAPRKRHRNGSAHDDLDTAFIAAVRLADDCTRLQPPLACGSTTAAEISAHVASAGAVDADESIGAATDSESESDKEEHKRRPQEVDHCLAARCNSGL